MLPTMSVRPGTPVAPALVALAATVLAACGGAEAVDPAERTPADAILYGQAVVQPEGDLKTTIEDLLARRSPARRPGRRSGSAPS